MVCANAMRRVWLEYAVNMEICTHCGLHVGEMWDHALRKALQQIFHQLKELRAATLYNDRASAIVNNCLQGIEPVVGSSSSLSVGINDTDAAV